MIHIFGIRPRRRMPVMFLATVLLSAGCDEAGVGGPGGSAEFIELEPVAEGLTSPVVLREAPDGSGRLFIADQAGMIHVVDGNGQLLGEPFLDLRDALVELRTNFDERGLLGFAFHPDYATNGRFYVYYSIPLRPGAPAEFNHTSRIAEFRVSGTPTRADRSSERVILEVDEPQFNHNAGMIDFGPDGFLYISLGDGGGANDIGVGHVDDWYDGNAGGNAQNVEANLLGKILRIDVDGAAPYSIPADNPFVGRDGRDEIYAYGFRNPYRFSFDMETGDLIVGDAGQNRWEEVNLVTRGGNYGWNVKEGANCFNAAAPTEPRTDCPSTGELGETLVNPVLEYQNARVGGPGVVVVGGVVYRGDSIPELAGRYVFGDYSRPSGAPDGIVYLAQPAGQTQWTFQELRFGVTGRPLGAYLLGFGQDLSGEVYVLTTQRGAPAGNTGRVYRLVQR